MAGLYSAKGTAQTAKEFFEQAHADMLEAPSSHATEKLYAPHAAIREFAASTVIHMVTPKWDRSLMIERIEKLVKETPRPQDKMNRVNQAAPQKPQPPKDDSVQVGDEAVAKVDVPLPILFGQPTWVPGKITIAIANESGLFVSDDRFMVMQVGAEYVYLIPQDDVQIANEGYDYTYLRIKKSTLARHFQVNHRSQTVSRALGLGGR